MMAGIQYRWSRSRHSEPGMEIQLMFVEDSCAGTTIPKGK